MLMSADNMLKVSALKKFYIVLCWAFLILVVSAHPIVSSPSTRIDSYQADKLVHFLLFFVLAYLIRHNFGARSIRPRSFIIILALTAIYAYSMEVLQLYVPGRSYSIADVLAGMAGAGAAEAIYYRLNVGKGKNDPEREKSLLLHICCAGCGAYVVTLLRSEFRVTLYYYNPNIHPSEELKKRAQEAERVAKRYRTPIIIPPQDHQEWLRKTAPYKDSPEGGERCLICYRDRLEKTAQKAKERGYSYFTTTMTVSPHKKARAINKIGRELGEKYNIHFLERDFKKQDGFKRSVLLSKELGLYRQNYCGCEFSRR